MTKNSVSLQSKLKLNEYKQGEGRMLSIIMLYLVDKIKVFTFMNWDDCPSAWAVNLELESIRDSDITLRKHSTDPANEPPTARSARKRKSNITCTHVKETREMIYSSDTLFRLHVTS